MKKILLVVVTLLVAVGLFMAGWSLRERKYNTEFNEAVKPAQQLVDKLIQQNSTTAYTAMPVAYRSNVSEAQFKESIANSISKDSKQTGLSIYQGADESLINFDVNDANDKAIGTLTVFTTKTKGKWSVSYIQLNKK